MLGIQEQESHPLVYLGKGDGTGSRGVLAVRDNSWDIRMRL